MAPPESAKVALGVLALAGIGLILYVVCKQLKKKKKTPENAESQGEQASSQIKRKESFSEETEPKVVQERQPDDEVEKEEIQTRASSSSAGTAKKEDVSSTGMVSESESFIATESTSLSTSMSGWEDMKPMDSSFVEVKPSSGHVSETQGAAGDMETSQMGQDSLSSFVKVGHGEESGDQRSKEDSTQDKSSSGDIMPSSTEAGLQSESRSQVGSEATPSLPSFLGQKEKVSADDVQSLQSEDTSSGEAPSFEQINGSDDATSLTGSNDMEGQQQQPLAESLQSFEQISMDSSSLKTGAYAGYGDTIPTFEHFSETGGPVSTKSVDSSIVVIPESLDGNLQSQEATQVEQKQQKEEEKGDSVEERTESQEQTERESLGEQMKTSEETSTSAEGQMKTSEETSTSAEGKSEVEEKLLSTSHTEEAQSQPPQAPSAPHGDGSGSGSGSLTSFEVVQDEKGLSDVKEYSSESLHSFVTATSGSGSSSSKQEFYSPLSSPPPVDSSFDDTSFQSFDDSTTYDTETSEELTFHDMETSGRQTPTSPQDRTPTNTPVPQEFGGGDAESAKTPMGDASSKIGETPFAYEADPEKSKGEEEAAVKSDSVAVKSDSMSETQQDTEETAETSAAAEPEVEAAPKPMLNIDRDKITEALLQAQNSPDKLEIGHLQILVELLKRDDWTLLNTTLQCLLRATAFTVNVDILRVCEGPKELSRRLEQFASQLASRGSKRSGQSQGLFEGAPRAEILFLNAARVVNNIAMDIKCQPQLEGSIPALTDLLMTEGISETVTLASLQPLTNLSSTKTYHGQYTRLLQQLYSFLDTSQSPSLRLQCLKLLVNLSLNADMVPHMLAAKAPSCLLDLLDINYDVELLLRTVTFLANVMTIMQERDLSPSNLPPDEKAPSPETLLSALLSHDHRDTLRNRVYRLTRHDSPDVCYQASRLYKFVATAK